MKIGRRRQMESKQGANERVSSINDRTVCGIKIYRSPMFQVVTGDERFKVVDLVTGGESFFDEKIQAYRMCSFIVNVLHHNYRLEDRE